METIIDATPPPQAVEAFPQLRKSSKFQNEKAKFGKSKTTKQHCLWRSIRCIVVVGRKRADLEQYLGDLNDRMYGAIIINGIKALLTSLIFPSKLWSGNCSYAFGSW